MPSLPCLLDDPGIVRVQEDVELRLVQVASRSTLAASLDAIGGVVQQHAQITDAAHTGLRCRPWAGRLDARVAEDALRPCPTSSCSRSSCRAATDAHAPAAALVLVNQHDAVFLALVDQAEGHDAAQAGFRQCSHRRGR